MKTQNGESVYLASASGADFSLDYKSISKSSTEAGGGKLKEEIIWLSTLSQAQAGQFPAVNGARWGKRGASLSTHFSILRPLSTYTDKGSLKRAVDVFSEVLIWVDKELHQETKGPFETLLSSVLKQTQERLGIAAKRNDRARALIEAPIIILNGIKMPGPKQIISILTKKIEAGLIEDGDILRKIHGDLHLGNILSNGSAWLLIDPRGSFPGSGSYGGIDYEWGKVLHDIHGNYNLIRSGRFSLNTDGSYQKFEMTISLCNELKLNQLMLTAFMSFLRKRLSSRAGPASQQILKLVIHEGLLMMGIAPFHLLDDRVALAYILLGVYIISKAINSLPANMDCELEGFLSQPIYF